MQKLSYPQQPASNSAHAHCSFDRFHDTPTAGDDTTYAMKDLYLDVQEFVESNKKEKLPRKKQMREERKKERGPPARRLRAASLLHTTCMRSCCT